MRKNSPQNTPKSPFVAAICAGETRREVLEPLLREQFEMFESQYRPNRSQWSHYDPELPHPHIGELAIFAALANDEALWMRLVEYAFSEDFAHRKMQQWSGVPEEDLGSFPSHERSAMYLRHQADAILSDVPASKCPVEPVLDRWQAKVEAAARAEDEQRKKGQRLREPNNVRSWNPNDHPDLKPEYDRLHNELVRRLSRDPRSENLISKGILFWNRRDHPDLAEAFDRIEDEVDRREGRRKPDIRVKVGDKVFGNGKHWEVTSVNERTGLVDLRWTDGKTIVGIPVDGDGLEPEP